MADNDFHYLQKKCFKTFQEFPQLFNLRQARAPYAIVSTHISFIDNIDRNNRR